MWNRNDDYGERMREYRPRRRPSPQRSRPRGGYDQGYGRDYWWIGEQAMRGRGPEPSYDARFRRFDKSHHPRYSPVGGMYPMGSRPMQGPPPPLREPHRFSQWTRWF